MTYHAELVAEADDILMRGGSHEALIAFARKIAGNPDGFCADPDCWAFADDGETHCDEHRIVIAEMYAGPLPLIGVTLRCEEHDREVEAMGEPLTWADAMGEAEGWISVAVDPPAGWRAEVEWAHVLGTYCPECPA